MLKPGFYCYSKGCDNGVRHPECKEYKQKKAREYRARRRAHHYVLDGILSPLVRELLIRDVRNGFTLHAAASRLDVNYTLVKAALNDLPDFKKKYEEAL